MLWVLLDVTVAVLAVVVLGMVGWSLYRHGRTLVRAVGASSTVLSDAAGDLSVQQPPQR